MARNRSMARSDLRSRLETASCTMHIPSLGIFRESKSEPSRVRACPPMCVHACVRELRRARAYSRAWLRRVPRSPSPTLEAAPRRAGATPGIHRYISPRTVITWRINTSYSASTGSLSRPVGRLDPQVYSACSLSLTTSLLPRSPFLLSWSHLIPRPPLPTPLPSAREKRSLASL